MGGRIGGMDLICFRNDAVRFDSATKTFVLVCGARLATIVFAVGAALRSELVGVIDR